MGERDSGPCAVPGVAAGLRAEPPPLGGDDPIRLVEVRWVVRGGQAAPGRSGAAKAGILAASLAFPIIGAAVALENERRSTLHYASRHVRRLSEARRAVRRWRWVGLLAAAMMVGGLTVGFGMPCVVAVKADINRSASTGAAVVAAGLWFVGGLALCLTGWGLGHRRLTPDLRASVLPGHEPRGVRILPPQAART